MKRSPLDLLNLREYPDWCQVRVTSSSGDTLSQHVIVTLPIGVMKTHHQDLFRPALPWDKVRSLERTGAGRISKIFLEWDTPWWADMEEATKYLGKLIRHFEGSRNIPNCNPYSLEQGGAELGGAA